MTVPLLLAALLATKFPTAAERIVLQTSAGGLVVSLHAGAAPRTVEYFKKLVGAGVYDGMRFRRVEPGYILQTSVAEDRERPMTREQSGLLHSVALERNEMKQIRGAISFAHARGDPDGGISSLSIALARADNLDDDYSVFAHVEEGFDVLDEIASAPVNAAHEPLIHVAIEHAQIVADLEKAGELRWPRRSLYSAAIAVSERGARKEVAALVATMLFCTMALAAMGRALSERWFRSARMAVLLLGGFGLVLSLLPFGQRASLLGGALFLGLVGLFKLMSRFESTTEQPSVSSGR